MYAKKARCIVFSWWFYCHFPSQEMSWVERHYFTKLVLLLHFQKLFHFDAFLNLFVLLKFNFSVSFTYGTAFFLSFTLQIFHTETLFLIFAVYFIYCSVCLLFVVSFLPTFNLSVVFSMTIFLVNDSISQTSTDTMCNTW